MIAPGPDMLFVLGCGMRGGPRAGLLATAGVETSEAIHVAVSAAGLSALFAAVPVAFTVVRIAGAVYLVYLGVRARVGPVRRPRRGPGRPGVRCGRRGGRARRPDRPVAAGAPVRRTTPRHGHRGLFIGLGVNLGLDG
ncbi:hypothetical protein GCM10029964_041810 [Kibdelosporangium lantanae]